MINVWPQHFITCFSIGHIETPADQFSPVEPQEEGGLPLALGCPLWGAAGHFALV